MIKTQIERLRQKLCNMIESNIEFEEIYKISVKLDQLINRYYKEIYLISKLGNVQNITSDS